MKTTSCKSVTEPNKCGGVKNRKMASFRAKNRIEIPNLKIRETELFKVNHITTLKMSGNRKPSCLTTSPSLTDGKGGPEKLIGGPESLKIYT